MILLSVLSRQAILQNFLSVRKICTECIRDSLHYSADRDPGLYIYE